MTPPPAEKTRRREADVRRALADAEKLGIPLAEAARRHGLPYSTLHQWKRKLEGVVPRKPRKKSARKPAPAFAEVRPPATATPILELTTPRGFRLRLPSGFAADEVKRLLAVIEPC